MVLWNPSTWEENAGESLVQGSYMERCEDNFGESAVAVPLLPWSLCLCCYACTQPVLKDACRASTLPPAVVGVLEVQMCSTTPIFLGVPGIAVRLSACVSAFDLMSHLPALGVLTGLLLLP